MNKPIRQEGDNRPMAMLWPPKIFAIAFRNRVGFSKRDEMQSRPRAHSEKCRE